MRTSTENEPIVPLLAGIAAEYFVAAELSRRGWIASLTLRNTRGIDILVSDSEASRLVGIQVKASQGGNTWLLNAKAETFTGRGLFYVFVRLADHDERPEFYVVPSAVVSKHVTSDHARWLATPGRQGQKHRDTPMRVFPRTMATRYLDRWDLLGLSPKRMLIADAPRGPLIPSGRPFRRGRR